MIAGQLGKVTGVGVEGEEFVDQIRSFLAGVGGFHLSTTLLALGVLVVLFALKHLPAAGARSADRGAVGDPLVMVFRLDRTGIDVVGAIRPDCPHSDCRRWRSPTFAELLIPALGLARGGRWIRLTPSPRGSSRPAASRTTSMRTPNFARSASATSYNGLSYAGFPEFQRQLYRVHDASSRSVHSHAILGLIPAWSWSSVVSRWNTFRWRR